MKRILFLTALITLLMTVAVSAADFIVTATDGNKVYGVENIVQYTNLGSTVFSADLNQSMTNKKVIYTGHNATVAGVKGKYLYVVEYDVAGEMLSGPCELSVINLETGDKNSILKAQFSGMKVDIYDEKIYIYPTSGTIEGHKLYSADIDGSNLNLVTEDQESGGHFALLNNKLYYVELIWQNSRTYHRVLCSEPDGSNPQVVMAWQDFDQCYGIDDTGVYFTGYKFKFSDSNLEPSSGGGPRYAGEENGKVFFNNGSVITSEGETVYEAEEMGRVLNIIGGSVYYSANMLDISDMSMLYKGDLNIAKATEEQSYDESDTQDTQIKLVVDGKTVDCTQPPVIVDGRTLVPVKDVADMLGCESNWDAENKVVHISGSGVSIDMAIGSNQVIIDGDSVIEADVPAQIINGRTMVPVSLTAGCFGAEVDWDGDTKTVSIRTNM